MTDTAPLDLEFTGAVRTKPEGGKVQLHEVPENLVKYLAANYKEVLESSDKDLILTAKDKTSAVRLALYSAVWGKNQTPKLYIKKLPNGKQYPENVCRLSIELD